MSGELQAEGVARDARIAAIYRDADSAGRVWVARLCDEALDRSGALLGRVRSLALTPEESKP